MTKQVNWNEGEGAITLTYNGEGDGIVAVTSDTNELLDRQQTITVKNERFGLSREVLVKQEGRREPYECADGEYYECTDGIYGLLKQ